MARPECGDIGDERVGRKAIDDIGDVLFSKQILLFCVVYAPILKI
jgi:hypothetical protein